MNQPADRYRCFYNPDPGAPPTEHCGSDHVDLEASEQHCAALNRQVNELDQHGQWAPVQGDILLALWEDDSDGETSLSVSSYDGDTEATAGPDSTSDPQEGALQTPSVLDQIDQIDRDFSLVGERLENTLHKLRVWITSRWNARLAIFIGVIAGGLLIGYLSFRAATQDDELATTTAVSETELEREVAATDIFWSNLGLATDDMLESFTVVCSERPECREEMQSLTAWACYLQHRSAFASSAEQPLARMMEVILREPVEMLRQGEIIADRAWQLLPDGSSAHMAENIVKAASPTVCAQAGAW